MYCSRRFGYPNKQALDEGRTGNDCRGEEHEVTVVWSIASGKRQITMDGHEVHFTTARTGIVEHSWSSKGNHILKVVCHASPPLSPTPGFRQYELFIDGQSFFRMPRMYEIGIKGVADSPRDGVESGGENYGGGDYGRNGGNYGRDSGYSSRPRAPATRNQEEEDLQRAISASLKESQQHLNRAPAPPVAAPAPTMDLFASPAPPPTPIADDRSYLSYNTVPTQVGHHQQPYAAAPYPGAPPPPQPYGQPVASAPAQGMLALPSTQPMPPAPMPAPPAPMPAAQPMPPVYGSPPPIATQPSFGGTPQQFAPPPAVPTANLFGPPADDPFAPKPPSQQDITNEILKSYSMSPTSAVPPPAAPEAAPAEAAEQPGANLSMTGGLMLTNEADEANLSELEKAMRKLVNVEHIDEPAEEKVKLTMKAKEETEFKKAMHKSRPIPPAAHRMVGSGATLSQIGAVKPKVTSPKEGIMSRPPWDPNAAAQGMLVIRDATSGPPPLQPGVGVVHGQGRVVHHGYPPQGFGAPPPQQQHQQQQPMYDAPPPQYAQSVPGYPPQPAQYR